VNSLQHKLGGSTDSKEFTTFLIQLMRGKEVSVPGGSRGDIGARITTMFRDAQKVTITAISIMEFFYVHDFVSQAWRASRFKRVRYRDLRFRLLT